MSYRSDFKLLLDYIEGKVKISREEFYEIVYKTYGGLDQIDRLKARDRALKDNFDMIVTEVIVEDNGKKCKRHKVELKAKNETVIKRDYEKFKTIFIGEV